MNTALSLPIPHAPYLFIQDYPSDSICNTYSLQLQISIGHKYFFFDLKEHVHHLYLIRVEPAGWKIPAKILHPCSVEMRNRRIEHKQT